MKKLFTSLFVACALLFASSCNDNNDANLQISGDGTISINSSTEAWIYRLVVSLSDSEVNVYLLGGTNTVTSTGVLLGRGAAVTFTYEATDATTLTAQDLTVGSDGTTASYATEVNYSSNDSDDAFTSFTTGTIAVTQAGAFYSIKILGDDADGNSISADYLGYIFAEFYFTSDSDITD